MTFSACLKLCPFYIVITSQSHDFANTELFAFYFLLVTINYCLFLIRNLIRHLPAQPRHHQHFLPISSPHFSPMSTRKSRGNSCRKTRSPWGPLGTGPGWTEDNRKKGTIKIRFRGLVKTCRPFLRMRGWCIERKRHINSRDNQGLGKAGTTLALKKPSP